MRDFCSTVTRRQKRSVLDDVAGTKLHISAKRYQDAIPQIVAVIDNLKVSDRQKKYFKQYYGLGCEVMSQSEIAEEYGISRARVCASITQTIRFLRRYAPLELPFVSERIVRDGIRRGMVVADTEDSVLCIDELPYAVRIALIKRGIRYLHDLEGFSEERLLRLRGIGPVYAKSIIETAALYGVSIS